VPPRKRHPYDQWSPDARALDLVGDKWTLLIVRDLAAGPRRFVELQRVLPGISTEQLRSRLNRMVADGMLTRERYREVPPRVDYALTERARDLMPVLGELARWGYAWAWSAPRSSESVDLGAIFRLAPGLLRGTDAVGTVEFAVTDDDSPAYAFTVCEGVVALEERESTQADTCVRGDRGAWIAAFSPDRDRAGLTIDGDAVLASLVLDALVGASAGGSGAERGASGAERGGSGAERGGSGEERAVA
jgi:DNA-binding HxlR family transcriptional regulator